ncbi:MAG: N-acetylmuramoyl-L-alanine amidase [Clostridiales bacterium]|nr:N-acetylmuramoyl-L-alanine amidase [Clostridiales bacterium]
MIFLIRRKYLIISLLLTAVIVSAFVFREPVQTAFSAKTADTYPVVIIDAGHGGEDGGAVSDNGVAESHINLAVAQKLQETLSFLGCRTVMTRTEDKGTYSDDAASMRQKKVSDLKNRVKLVNDIENDCLISVHQNSLPGYPTVRGAQVFYNTEEGSSDMAEQVQSQLNLTINAGNEKQTKKIPATIYLMKNVTCPAILVECGFLSNPEETQRLQDEAYQLKLAMSIAAGYHNHSTNEGTK